MNTLNQCPCEKDHSKMEREPTRLVVTCRVCKKYFHPAKYAPMCMPDQWVCYECIINEQT